MTISRLPLMAIWRSYSSSSISVCPFIDFINISRLNCRISRSFDVRKYHLTILIPLVSSSSRSLAINHDPVPREVSQIPNGRLRKNGNRHHLERQLLSHEERPESHYEYSKSAQID
uniref:Secreted protein n=1 Tax=Heterorhabditis bacteriophora TaxID=37862 RepID=A0A1I7X3W1_HETBA